MSEAYADFTSKRVELVKVNEAESLITNMDNKTVLTGNLKFLSLGDLLQLLGANGRTGVLSLSSAYTMSKGLVYLDSGEVVNAEYGHLTEIEAVNALFGWQEGVFEFSSKEITCEKAIRKSRMQIILDALSKLDEGEIERIGPVVDQETTGNDPKQEKKTAGQDHGIIRGPFVDYMYVVDEEHYEQNNTIIKEGSHGNWMWVVLEGQLSIIKDDIPIATVGSGAFIGSVSSIVSPGYKRSASVKAVTNVQLGVLDSQALVADLNNLSQAFKEWFLSADKRFRRVSERLVAYKKSRNPIEGLPQGLKPMIKQGDVVKKNFQILNGNAYIVKKTDKEKFFLCCLDKGDFIGYIPIMNMNHEPHGASVYVTEDLKLKIVNSETIQQEYETISQTLKNMIEYKAMCITATTRMIIS